MKKRREQHRAQHEGEKHYGNMKQEEATTLKGGKTQKEKP
jgi:hypothetical protein